jgi:hypothetical protein
VRESEEQIPNSLAWGLEFLVMAEGILMVDSTVVEQALRENLGGILMEVVSEASMDLRMN